MANEPNQPTKKKEPKPAPQRPPGPAVAPAVPLDDEEEQAAQLPKNVTTENPSVPRNVAPNPQLPPELQVPGESSAGGRDDVEDEAEATPRRKTRPRLDPRLDPKNDGLEIPRADPAEA